MSDKIEKQKLAPFFGQWIGKFEGSCLTPSSPTQVFPGSAIFNIERDRPNQAFACIDQGNNLHGSRKDFSVKIEGNSLSGHGTSTSAFDWQKNEKITIEESIKRQKSQGMDIFYLTDLEVHDGFIDQQSLTCSWSGSQLNKKLTGTFKGQKLGQNTSSSPNALMKWEEFKSFIAKEIQSGYESFFRGQASNKHRLNTSFHRECRYDLERYDTEACAVLAQHINATSSRQYDRNNPSDFGPLLSLAQHHGFPTPLLDWSKSPYIAAFFAFERRPIINDEENNPRIYVFNAMAWRQDTTQVKTIADPRPTLTPLEFLAHNNPRQLPQQSVHTYTNLEDPEAWIRLTEKEKAKKYLTVIDIPRSERKFAMRDLAYMGVTAAALFPGLDGACRSLKEQIFPL